MGDSAADVIYKCGSPDFTQSTGLKGTSKTKTGSLTRSGNGPAAPSQISRYKEVATERWYYNLGPNDFIYGLHFEGGTLKKIIRGDRGR